MSVPDPQHHTSPPHAPLRSSMSGDPDMTELVQFFVDEMRDRINAIQTAAEGNDLDQLRMVAHQLKGSGAGYGFEPISSSAGKLEHLIDSGDDSAQTQDLRQQVDELIDLCRRVSI